MGCGTREEFNTVIDSEKLLNHLGVHHACLHIQLTTGIFEHSETSSWTTILAHMVDPLVILRVLQPRRNFNHEEGRTLLLEIFLSPTYLNTIQTSCPWVLRYLAAAAILSRKASVTSSAGTTQSLLVSAIPSVNLLK